MARNTIWEDLVIGLKAFIADLAVAIIFGGVYFILGLIGLLTLDSALFWILMVILVPLSIGIYLWLKGIILRLLWKWE